MSFVNTYYTFLINNLNLVKAALSAMCGNALKHHYIPLSKIFHLMV